MLLILNDTVLLLIPQLRISIGWQRRFQEGSQRKLQAEEETRPDDGLLGKSSLHRLGRRTRLIQDDRGGEKEVLRRQGEEEGGEGEAKT